MNQRELAKCLILLIKLIEHYGDSGCSKEDFEQFNEIICGARNLILKDTDRKTIDDFTEWLKRKVEKKAQ